MFGRRGGEGAADLQRCHALAERMEGGGGVVDATRAEAPMLLQSRHPRPQRGPGAGGRPRISTSCVSVAAWVC